MEHRLTLPMDRSCQGLLDDVRKLGKEEAEEAVLATHMTPDCMLVRKLGKEEGRGGRGGDSPAP